jgi:L-lactate dehydrogenase complex protein LldG
MSVFKNYKKDLVNAAHDPNLRTGISRSIAAYRLNVTKSIEKFPHSIELAKEVRKIKEKSIPQMETLAAQACEAIQEKKGHAHIAKTGEEAMNIIKKIVGKGKLVVLGKTMTGLEIGLREHLEAEGKEVYETDVGELIVQLLGQRPMHITTPAAHITKEKVAELFSKVSGEKMPPDPPTLVAFARKFLREKYYRADVGITGANVLAADTGMMFIIENEGNVRLVSGFPPIHIALVGMEKLVATYQEGWKVAEVNWRYVGYGVPNYVNIITGPSGSGDIEKMLVLGASGPIEYHVVFLDGGRTDLAKHPILRQTLYCLRCGGCLWECPVFAVTGGKFGDDYFGGIGAVWAGIASKHKEKAAAMAYTCLTCGRCKHRCPMDIDIPAMVVELRRLINEGN